MILIPTLKPKKYNSTIHFIEGLENVIKNDKNVQSERKIYQHLPFRLILGITCYLLAKYKIIFTKKIIFSAKKTKNPPRQTIIQVRGGISTFSFYYYSFLSSHKKSIYLFDMWPDKHDKMLAYIKYFNLDYVFISSSQVVDIFNRHLDAPKCFWIPEAIVASEYKSYSLDEKTIDVLAFGRRYELYHELTYDYLNEHGYKYVHPNSSGDHLFKTQQDFIEGLARSKISICFPSNITHPERSGDIETMTIRYLQSMASKCLIVGIAPKEMIDLFGYNPVIEADIVDPKTQLKKIIENFFDYQNLIEKNYKNVIENHTWKNRWSKIKLIVKK